MTPAQSGDAATPEPASLVVIDPNGNRTRVPITPLPFHMGRQPGNDLILRDSRTSRTHACIVFEAAKYFVEDEGSRHGTFVNGERVQQRRQLHSSDRIELGATDSYRLIFALDGEELKRLVEQMGAAERPAPAPHGVGGNLAKLRAILDLARTLQNSFSVDDVLAQVVDTALAITGAERGFLLLRNGDGLDTRVARNREGRTLHENELRVPREVLQKSLRNRRELLSMNFDPMGNNETRPQGSIVDLELRSVICVPLVRIRTALGDSTSLLSTDHETVGALYMDSRISAADLTGGNRELLQTLAIEASTVLENARLLEEERSKLRLSEELSVARTIQQSLLPKWLPSAGWMRAAGSSVASREVGGDYYDVSAVNADCWSAVVADVSGKGVSSALLASLLQGALISTVDESPAMTSRIERLNQFLIDRTGGEKYATVFHCLIGRDGLFRYINAAHCPPIVRSAEGTQTELDATGMPVGLIEGAKFEVGEYRLYSGDLVVIYSDGVTEAENSTGEFYGKKRLKDTIAEHASKGAAAVHDAIHDSVAAFAAGEPQADDITVVVLEIAEG